MTEKVIFQSIRSIVPFLPKIFNWVRNLWRECDEVLVLDDLANRNLQFVSGRKTSLFSIERCANLLLKDESRRDLKMMKYNDFEAYTVQILPLLKQQQSRYDATYSHKVFLVMDSVKLARKMGISLKHIHCLVSDDELFNSQIKNMSLNDRKALCVQRERLKNEKMNDKTYHEYSSINEMNKIVYSISKGTLRHKITFEEDSKADDFE